MRKGEFMLRTTLTLGGHSYALAQGVRIDDLKSRLEAAVSSGGKFVDVTLLGNIAVSILTTPGVPVVLTTEQVGHDPRDTGELAEPFDYTEWEMSELIE
jgi:hypothetical protein